MPELLDRLRDHCRTRPGVTLDEWDGFTVLASFLDTFAQFYPAESPAVALLRLRHRDHTALAKQFPGVRKSDKMHWDTKGWAWTDVPIDGSVPEPTLLQLIDQSYQLVLDDKDEQTRYQLTLLGRHLSPRALLA